MTGLNALIEKLEKATEGSDELDYDIARAIDQKGSVGFRCVGDERAVWFRSFDCKIDCPNFTTSLDAALTLVPPFITQIDLSAVREVEGLTWTDNRRAYALLHPHVESAFFVKTGIGLIEGDHSELEIALCIAALKARAAC